MRSTIILKRLFTWVGRTVPGLMRGHLKWGKDQYELNTWIISRIISMKVFKWSGSKERILV